MSAADNAAAFAATESIRAGDWDAALIPLLQVIQDRRRRLEDMSEPPPKTREMIASGHQVWVGMNGPGKPHWEVRGTGALL
jgi:hypothetical protein